MCKLQITDVTNLLKFTRDKPDGMFLVLMCFLMDKCPDFIYLVLCLILYYNFMNTYRQYMNTKVVNSKEV